MRTWSYCDLLVQEEVQYILQAAQVYFLCLLKNLAIWGVIYILWKYIHHLQCDSIFHWMKFQ